MEEVTSPKKDGGGGGGGGVVIQEGLAQIHFENEKEVFYNPVQEFNRDISIAAIQLFIRQNHSDTAGQPLSLLEALSASGLRSVRYAKEIRGLTDIVANDISKKAVQTIQKNIERNGVADTVRASHNDASMAMYLCRQPSDRFDIVDLDPYGSPTPFLDAAVQSVAEGGLLCVTCTDMAVLCGNTPETCYTKYGAIGLKSKSCHEMALRIVLQSIESHANRYGRYIEPLVSLSIDFYVRLFVRVRTGQAVCKRTTSKLGYVYQCHGCESITQQPLGRLIYDNEKEKKGNIKYKLCSAPPVNRTCQFCGKTIAMGGPFWLAPIHDKQFLESLIESLEIVEEEGEAEEGEKKKFGTLERMRGMLTVAAEELLDVPFYYTQDRLTSMVRTGSGKMVDFRSALLNAGYRVSLSHANKLALKTDAPNSFIWAMMRAWEKEHPANRAKMAKDSVALALLDGKAEAETKDISFRLHPQANPDSRTQQLKRFQINPERNWGPKCRASAASFEDPAKRRQNQGKKRKQGELSPKQEESTSAAGAGADVKRINAGSVEGPSESKLS